MSAPIKQTTGQRTGVEGNPTAPDNMQGNLDSAQPGRQTPNLPLSRSSGAMNTPLLTSALDADGLASDRNQALFSGPSTGPDTLRQTMESQDSREVRWPSNPNFKSSAQESSNPFTSGGNIRVSERMPDEMAAGFPISTDPVRFKPGQSSKPNTTGKDD